MPRKNAILLPAGCWCSPFCVHPKNYKSSVRSMDVEWYISYRFYDPTCLDKKGRIKPYQRIIRGMNEFHEWKLRKEATALIIEEHLELLKNQGLNPRTKAFAVPAVQTGISPDTLLLQAFDFAKSKLKTGDSVQKNLKSILKHVGNTARQLQFHKLAIGDIRRKHMKLLLQQLSVGNEKWTANTFNHYRKHLSILFNELLEYDAVEFNPVKAIKKEKHVRKLRRVLTDTERELVYDHLGKIYPAFRRAMEIFYHSGIRETEMLAIRMEDVDLGKERVKVTVRKGGQPSEEWREIKSIAVDLWKELMQTATAGDYVFSYRFIPGAKKAAADYITKSWYRYVKNKKMQGIGIEADFYALKHLHTTEVVDLLDEQSAAKHNGHKSTAMVEKVYDVENSSRKGKLVKMLRNEFIKKIH